MENIKVGIAAVDYTPEIGLPLMGNFRDDYASRGMHDPLMARAIVFEDSDGQKAAMLSVDNAMIGRKFVQIMRKHIEGKCGISGDNILIAATHTHSGPGVEGLKPMPACEAQVSEKFLKKATTAVIEANKRLCKSTLKIGTTNEERLSFVRRLKCKDGKTHMNWEGLDPDFIVEALGKPDPQVLVLTVEQEGVSVAAAVNFGLHPAVLAGDNWLYSADYPGYLSEAMRRVLGEEFVMLFFNGCCGNVNHIDYTDKLQGRGYQMTQRIGHMLAVSAIEAMKNDKAVGGDKVAVSRKLVELPRIKISCEQKEWAERVLEEAANNPAAGQVDGLPDEFYANVFLRLYEVQNEDDKVEVMAFRIGNVGIVGLPGEIFCELGLQIKRQSPAKHTLVIELANDAIGYLPTNEAFAQGGYEVTPGVTQYEKGAGEKITESAISQIEKLF